jgi:hypothetical protein
MTAEYNALAFGRRAPEIALHSPPVVVRERRRRTIADAPQLRAHTMLMPPALSIAAVKIKLLERKHPALQVIDDRKALFLAAQCLAFKHGPFQPVVFRHLASPF